MKILLMGNGFDLYHQLPTKYSNYINTLSFLIAHYNESMNTVGKVLGDDRLQQIDKDILCNYQCHKEIYEQTALDPLSIQVLIKKTKSNHWFQYLSKFVTSYAGWVDFEKEIYHVIRSFMKIPSGIPLRKVIDFNHVLTEAEQYMISQFAIFGKLERYVYKVDEQYTVEVPCGSKNRILDFGKIADALFAELEELAETLRIYLECFVENPVKYMQSIGLFPAKQELFQADYVLTFNYTQTYECLYNLCSTVTHIHGNISDKIILGINPDEYDELEHLNISFLQFKKYYQRVIQKSDISYILEKTLIQKNRKFVPEIELYVIGHSLDVTDQDIIKDLFELATSIKIYVHDVAVVGSYVKNMVSIFGKNHFDLLREQKGVDFVLYPKLTWR